MNPCQLTIIHLMDRILAVRYENPDLERDLCLELVELAEKEEYLYGTAFAYVYLVDCYLSQNDKLVCAEYLRKAKSICEANGFQDLRLRLCNFAGLYYQRLGDEQAALTSHLHGLDLAREQNDFMMESNILNSIGLGFKARGDYTTAKCYYQSAYEGFLFRQTRDDESRCVVFLCNLAETSQYLGQLMDSQRYLKLCEAIDTEAYYKKYRLYAGWCCHYAFSNDPAASIAFADKILDSHLEKLEDRYFTIELFQVVCSSMLRLKLKNYSKHFLNLLSEFRSEADLEFAYKLIQLKIQYAELFLSKKQQLKAYREYYILTKAMEELDNKVHADGMMSRILLMEALDEKEMIHSQNIKLQDASYLDELTFLYNRRYFNKMVSKAFNRKDITTLGFIMLDVDFFKEYNDFYGHNKGDQVLFAVGQCIKSDSEERVCSGRYGGDEFVCLCMNMTDDEVEAYIRKVRGELEGRQMEHQCSKCHHHVTLSIGWCNEQIGEVEEASILLELADQALYEAKENGRNGYWRKRRMEKL